MTKRLTKKTKTNVFNIGGLANLHLGFDGKGIDPLFIDDVVADLRACYARAIQRSIDRSMAAHRKVAP